MLLFDWFVNKLTQAEKDQLFPLLEILETLLRTYTPAQISSKAVLSLIQETSSLLYHTILLLQQHKSLTITGIQTLKEQVRPPDPEVLTFSLIPDTFKVKAKKGDLSCERSLLQDIEKLLS